MGLKFSKQDKIEEVRVRQLPTPEDRDEIAAVLTDEPENAFANLDWGVYLAHIEKKFDEAEQYLILHKQFSKSNTKNRYFVYAMELDRYSARCVGFYALFQELEKKDIEKAGELYKKGYDDIISLLFTLTCALKQHTLREDEVNFMCNYAIYQRTALKNPQLSEQTYKKLVAANPNHAIAHGDFGILLADEEFERAEHHLAKAAELEPNVAHWQLAYANFLKNEKKDPKAAKKYFTQAKAAKEFQKEKAKESARKERERAKKEKKAMKDSFD